MWSVMPSYSLINKLEQFGKVSYTVITDGGLRFPKEYNLSFTPEQIDADILSTIEAISTPQEPIE